MPSAMTIPVNLLDQINEVRDYDISYYSMHPKALIKDKQTERVIQVPYSAFTNKYKDILSTIIITKELSPEEKREFWYKPKSVSLFFYNTTELWSDMLIINNCAALREFTPEKLKYYDPTELKKIINEIMILEDAY